MTASMESWKIEAQNINSRCGFCGMTFDKWQDRVDHLAKEFRNGANMKQWKGCRGLDPAIAVQVTNAMPPYLISNERKSPFPFSATNSSSLKQQFLYSQPADLEAVLPAGTLDNTVFEEGKRIGLHTPRSSGSSNHGSDSNAQSDDADTIATCWEILTLRLGRFARQYMEKHQTNTILDSILQSKARCILYGEDDPWHQTAADNPDWLSLFKQAHGIQGTYASVPAHDALEDLGIRANADLDPSFNMANFNSSTLSQGKMPLRSALLISNVFFRVHSTCRDMDMSLYLPRCPIFWRPAQHLYPSSLPWPTSHRWVPPTPSWNAWED